MQPSWLLPIFAQDIWNGGPEAYGALLSAAGAGALIGAFGLASIRQIRHQGALMIVSGLLFSASIVAFASSPSLVLGVVLSIVAGVSATVFGTIIATFIQAATPNELRGRVMSLYSITLIGLPALGSLGSGASAEWLGGPGGAPRAVVVGAAILGIVLVLVAPFFWQRAVQRSAAASKRG